MKKKVADITPEWHPKSVSKEITKVVEDSDCTALGYFALMSDGHIDSDVAGLTRKDVLWAVEQMILHLEHMKTEVLTRED